MVEENKSPRLSFSGYSLKKALYRNKDAVKVILLIIVGLNVLGLTDVSNLIEIGKNLLIAISGLFGKLLLDAFDYYFAEVKN